MVKQDLELLKEAIADAKTVQKTALANAKLAMEEAFAPKLHSMLSAKIQKEVEGDDEVELSDVVDEVEGDEFDVTNIAQVPAEVIPAEEPTTVDDLGVDLEDDVELKIGRAHV